MTEDERKIELVRGLFERGIKEAIRVHDAAMDEFERAMFEAALPESPTLSRPTSGKPETT